MSALGQLAGDPRPQEVVAHLEDDLLTLGPPAAQDALEVGLGLGRSPHRRQGGLGVEHGVDQLTGKGHGLGTRGAVGEDHGTDPVLAPDPEAGQEPWHRSAGPTRTRSPMRCRS
jgi:hypothetical protein